MGILGSSLSSLGGGFSGLGSVISGFAAGGVVGAAAAGLGQVIQGLQWATKEASANQQAWTDLQAALKLTGGEWDAAKGKINEFASAIQKTTTFSDEMVVGAVQRMATFGMSYQQGMAAVSTAVELAAAKHIDLQTATDLLGKAFMGNTAILSRYGINIDQIKESMGKGASDAQIYEAVLGQLNEQFGGTAVAQAQTYAGAQERLKNAMSDLGEKIGGMLVPALASFTEGMIPVVDWLGQGIDKVQAWITAVGKMPEVKAATDAVGVAFQGFQKWLGDVASTAMTELGPALQELWSALKEIFDALAPIGEAFAEIWAAFSDGEGSGNILKDILGLIADNIKLIAAAIKFVAPYIKMLAEAFKVAAEFITPILLTIRDAVGGFLSFLHDAFEGFYNWLVGHSLWQDLWNGLVSVVQNVGPIIGGIITGLFTLWNSIITGGMEIVKGLIIGGFQLAFDTITMIVRGASDVLAMLIGVVTTAIGGAQKGWTDLTVDIGGTSDKIRQLIQNLWDWLSKFWQDRLTDMVTRSNEAFLKLTTGIQNTQATWASTLSAMEATTRNTFNAIVSDISQAVDAIIARLRSAQSQISSHSIWPDMLSQMLKQTREGLGAIQGEFANAITGPVGIVPSLQAAEFPTPIAASQPQSMTQQLITVPIHVYLDGTEIQTLLERRLIENLNQQGKSVRA
jgi:phage-related protein